MTKDQLEILKLKSQIQALQVVLSMICAALGRTFPSFSESLQETGNQLRESHSKIALKGYPPELSDLIAGEYQEALDDILNFIEDGIKK